MIVSLFPFAAFAGDANTNVVYVNANVAASSGTTYKTLQEAVTAAKTNPTTIVLQSNVNLSQAVLLTSDQDITINGNDNEITFNFEGLESNSAFKITGSLGNETANTPTNVTLNVNSVTFKDEKEGSNGYGIVVGANAVGANVNLKNCKFENLYCGVLVNYFNENPSNVTAPSLAITNSTYTNTTYGYSVDETTDGTYVGAVNVQFGSENESTTDNFLDKEYWSGIVYVTHGGVTHPYKSVADALAVAVDGDTITLNPGEYSGFKVTNKSLNFVGRTIGSETAVVNDATVMFADKVSFKGITFNGASNEDNLDVNNSALYFQDVKDAQVNDCTFELDENKVTTRPYPDDSNTNLAIVTTGIGNTNVSDCVIKDYDYAACHNADYDAASNQTVTYTGNKIENVPAGIEFAGIENIVVENNVFENSSGLSIEPTWSNTPATKSVTVTENQFNIPDSNNAFAVKTFRTGDGTGMASSELNLNYNYWGSTNPDFGTLIQTDGNENINVVTDEYYKAPEMNESDLNTYYDGKYSYAINVANMDNGSVSVDKYATEGEKVTLTVSPDKAYKLDELTVTANGKDVELTDNGDGTYTFTMPSSNVKVSASFVEDKDYVEPDDSITVSMTIGSNDFVINNNIVTVPDAAPYIANDRTYVPFRALGEALGAKVVWDNDARTVTYTLGDTEIVMTIGDTTYTINGVEKTMDVAPEITGDRTYVPVRFVAEGLGFKVTPLYADNGTTASVVFEK